VPDWVLSGSTAPALIRAVPILVNAAVPRIGEAAAILAGSLVASTRSRAPFAVGRIVKASPAAMAAAA